MITDDEWLGFINVARVVQPGTPGSIGIGAQIKGRFIAALANRLVKFWGQHASTLTPFLTQLAIAALNALTAAIGDIKAVDPPGPD